MEGFIDVLKNFIGQMGFAQIGEDWKVLIMMALACVLLYAAIVKKWEKWSGVQPRLTVWGQHSLLFWCGRPY